MNIGQIRVDCVFYNIEKNVRVPMTQIFDNKANANCWVAWLKKQDEIVLIEVYKQTQHGEMLTECWS